MYEIETDHKQTPEIELQRLAAAVLKKIWFVVAAAALGAAAALLATLLFVKPQYQSEVLFYVNNSTFSVGGASLSLSSGDLTTSRNLVDSYIVILNTRESLTDVRDYAGVKRTYVELRDMIRAESVDETEIFRVTVTSADPEEAERIADAIAGILPKRIASIIQGTSAAVVDAPVRAVRPSSPSYVNNTLLGFAVGLVLAVSIVVLQVLFDVTIRSEEAVKQCCSHPILAVVPDMQVPARSGIYGAAAGKRTGKPAAVMGKDISFAASEAYKLLRTKLQFSFTREKRCGIIGISSAMTGEGKSLTAVNLAWSLSQLGKKVLLIDGDMRRPSICSKLSLQKTPGLSDFLTGQSGLEPRFQSCAEEDFRVLSAGCIPPNPMELLDSAAMETLLRELRQEYDYILLDLPPVGEVSDALAAAKFVDGFLLVVRENCCNRMVLKDTLRQFAFVNARILGVVYNGAGENGFGKEYHKTYYGGIMPREQADAGRC